MLWLTESVLIAGFVRWPVPRAAHPGSFLWEILFCRIYFEWSIRRDGAQICYLTVTKQSERHTFNVAGSGNRLQGERHDYH